ncbi:MAG: glycosyltransferase [Phycisphaerae bacterium]|nr:glycosyltransferase [Phycisphaerae bacterium]
MKHELTNRKIAGLIFSRDRAIQLCAVLESFHARCRDRHAVALYVLFKVSDEMNRRQYDALKKRFADVTFIEETHFKQQTIDIAAGGDHVLFMVDDNLFVRDFHIEQAIAGLQHHPEAIGFSLRLGRNTVHNYNRNVRMTLPEFACIDTGVLKYDWTSERHDFGYPLEISSSVYRTADILPLIRQLDFANPNLLEGLMAANARPLAARWPCLLCFDLSVTFCNPLNMVQTVCTNRTGGDARYSARNLAALYADGWRIDIAHYNGLIPCGCHQDMELVFRKESADTTVAVPLVTIEMITCNQEKYIRRAIDSVLAQTYPNFELLIVDDGSTDATPRIIASYTDSRVRCIFQEHKNRWAGTNRALAEARGRYILAVDSDDFIASDYLEKMVAFAEKHPDVDYVYPAELLLVDPQDQPTGARWQYHDFADNRLLPHYLFDQGHSPIPYPGSLRRMTLFQKTGPYDELPNVADFVFLCRNALKISFKRVADHATYYYRVLTNSLSRNFDARDRTIARTLHEMVALYPPEALCPAAADVDDPVLKTARLHQYAAETFRKHAAGYHLVKNGDYFRHYAALHQQESHYPPSAAAHHTWHKQETCPLVTVEMVTYNNARYIGRAIESVLAQTCTEFELLIVDDGSTDDTADVVDRYADSRIRYIRRPHVSCAAARNHVLRAARGTFILCVDSDDFIGPDYLRKMLACAGQHPDVDYFYPAQLTPVDASGRPDGKVWRYSDVPDNRALPGYLFHQAGSPIPNPGSLKRRSMFDRTGPYDEFETVEDFVLLCRHALKIRFKRVDDHAAYFYRRLDSGLSRKAEARDRITSEILSEMVQTYPAELLLPQIASVTDHAAKQQLYLEYLARIFEKHAAGYHMVRHGRYFKKYADACRFKLKNTSQAGREMLQRA